MLQLIKDQLAIAQANSITVQRDASRRYALHLLEYAWVGLQMKRGTWRAKCWPLRWFVRADEPSYFAMYQESVAGAYWWLRLVQAREDGKLPAWEGILLVRERKTTEELEREKRENIFEKLVPEW